MLVAVAGLAVLAALGLLFVSVRWLALLSAAVVALWFPLAFAVVLLLAGLVLFFRRR